MLASNVLNWLAVALQPERYSPSSDRIPAIKDPREVIGNDFLKDIKPMSLEGPYVEIKNL
jgi:hypothetical protein